MATYNLIGRRDNKYKARIKITVHERGIDEIRRMVEAEFPNRRAIFGGADQALLAEIGAAFAPPAFADRPTGGFEALRQANPAFRAWTDTNLAAAPGAGLRHRHRLAEGARRDAGRRDGRPDARAGRPRRALRPLPSCGSATSRT